MKIMSFEKEKRENFKSHILTCSDIQIIRYLRTLYFKQTENERFFMKTIFRNRQGFSMWQARKLTYLARLTEDNKYLKQRHLDYLRKILPHYWRQLS